MKYLKGVSALFSVIALGTIIVLTTGTAMWIENNRVANNISDVNSADVIAAADSALQDAILKLNLKNSTDNYSLTINGVTVGVCYEADPLNAGIYTIRTKAIKGNIARAMKALVNKDATTLKYDIYSKEEELDSICTITEATVPGAPQNPVWASSANGQVTINWLAPASNGYSAITNYKIYRGTTSGGETLLTTLGNVLTITDTGLTNNTVYYYKISAVNAVGEGALSAEVSAIPGSAPTGSVAVSNYAYGNYVGATYQITGTFTSSTTATACDYSTNGGTTWIASSAPTGTLPNYTCTKTGVSAQDNVNYSITMRMTNSIGPGSASAITKTGDATGPTITDNWTDAWTTTSPVTITLTPVDSGAGVSLTKYCIDTTNACSPSSGTTYTASFSITCTSGSNCTQYVRYAAWDNVNNASAIYSKRVRQDKLVPSDGTLTVTPGPYQNSLSWSGFSDSGSGLASTNTYKVVFLTTGSPNTTCSNGTQVYLGTGTSTTHTSLTGGTTYYYRVCAYDTVGNISNGATGNGVPTTTTTLTTQPACSCGSWSTCSCSYGSTCATSATGTQTRTCTPSGCDTESRSCTCTRSTDGISCGSNSACTYSGCAGSYNTYTCGGGTCNITQLACNKSAGTSCGTPTYSNCGACSLSGCSGTKICDYTTYSCDGSGSCVAGTDIGGGILSCTASDGTLCGSRTVWGSCSSAVSCGAYPYKQYGTVYSSHCSSGSCIEDGSCSNCENRCCTPE